MNDIQIFITHLISKDIIEINDFLVEQVVFLEKITKVPHNTTIVYYSPDGDNSIDDVYDRIPRSVKLVKNDRKDFPWTMPCMRNKVLDLANDYFVLLHSDIRVSVGWLDSLIYDFKKSESLYGEGNVVMSPRYVPYHYIPGVIVPKYPEFLDGIKKSKKDFLSIDEMTKWCKKWNFKFEKNMLYSLTPGSEPFTDDGHALMMFIGNKKFFYNNIEGIEYGIGGNDERYIYRRHDDDDWGITALMKGKKNLKCQTSFIGHMIHLTLGHPGFKKSFFNSKNLSNHKFFIEKWGKDIFDETVNGKIWIRLHKEQLEGKKEYYLPSLYTNTITFFVFVGEFGYEILSSHGWLRALKNKLPNFKIGVASRGGTEFLYEDCCDTYIDITDLLSKYVSDMFGTNLSDEDKQKIYKRCSEVCKENKINIIYSNQKYSKDGIIYCTGSVRDYSSLMAQNFKLLTLKKYIKEKEYIMKQFPELSNRKYVVLHDRRRDRAWGRTNIEEDLWKYIINRLIQSGYLVVLIGYEPYKIKDAYSIFYKDEFKNIRNTVNMSNFLNNNIKNNILYQAIIIQNAEFFLGIWGSAGYLPPLLGIDSYLLTIDRRPFNLIENDADLWNKFLSVGKGRLHCLNTTTERESIINALEKVKILKR